MDYKRMQQRLTAIFNGLDNVSVKGYNNILNMAGVMQVVSETRQEIAQILKEEDRRQRENAAMSSAEE